MASDSRENAQWKRFNGENLDGKEYRKWRLWVEAKMAAAKDLTPKQRGPFVFCLLDGLALETVEHVTLEMMMEENGDKHIWSVLDERFPDKQKHDWMAECLREVFQITSSEGETMTAFTSPGGLLQVSEEGERRLPNRGSWMDLSSRLRPE